jgi:hypothetical protein
MEVVDALKQVPPEQFGIYEMPVKVQAFRVEANSTIEEKSSRQNIGDDNVCERLDFGRFWLNGIADSLGHSKFLKPSNMTTTACA